MSLLGIFAETISNIILQTGYAGICFFMILESMVFPIPSELVMPFAGYLAGIGKLDFWLVSIAATIGSIIGSLLSYYIGYFGGKPFVKKYGKYFLLNEKHLEETEKFFEKFGSITVFVARFVPVIRHLISIPAGAAKMRKRKFLAYTVLGAFCWNALLAYSGILLGQNWKTFSKYSSEIDLAIIFLIIVGIVWLVWKNFSKKKR